MVKADIVSGFLGAGKTTLIKKLIAEAFKGEKVVLIENEFKEIAIDSGFLKDLRIEIREMSQGSVHCSLVGDFEDALRKAISRFGADRVIIELSGVGKLSDVIMAVNNTAGSMDVVLNSVITAVDVKKCGMYSKVFGEYFENQIKYAGTILLTRTEAADDKTVNDAIAYLSELNKNAEIISAPLVKLSGEKLLEIVDKRNDVMRELIERAKCDASREHHQGHHPHENCEHYQEHHAKEPGEHCGRHQHGEHMHQHHEHGEHCGHHKHDEHMHKHHEHGEHCGHHQHGEHTHHHHEHGAGELFDSCALNNLPPVSKEKLESILNSLSENKTGMILRAKGMVPASDSDSWYYFNYVPGEYEIKEDVPDYTGRASVIGSGIDKDNIKQLFYA